MTSSEDTDPSRSTCTLGLRIFTMHRLSFASVESYLRLCTSYTSSSSNARSVRRPSTNNNKTSTMVKVWYTPPPYGPRTSLDRPAYGLGKVGTTPEWLVRLAKAPKVPAITGVITVFSIMAWLPLCTSVCDFYCTYVIQSYSHFSLLLIHSGRQAPIHHVP